MCAYIQRNIAFQVWGILGQVSESFLIFCSVSQYFEKVHPVLRSLAAPFLYFIAEGEGSSVCVAAGGSEGGVEPGGPYVSFSDACLGYKCCALTHRRQWAVHAHLPDTLGPLLWGQWCGQMWCLTLWCWPCGQMWGARRMRRCSPEPVVLRAAPPAPALLLAPLGTPVSWRLTRVCALRSFFAMSNLLEGVWRQPSFWCHGNV